MAKVKYRLKSHPTRIKKIGRVVTMTGVALVLLGDLVVAPIFRMIPLELWIVMFEEIIPILFANVWVLGLILLFMGMFLESFNWRTGNLNYQLQEDQIKVKGLIPIELLFKDLTEMAVFDMKVGLQRSVRFQLPNERLTIKFASEAELLNFIGEVTPNVRKYDNVKVGSWVD